MTADYCAEIEAVLTALRPGLTVSPAEWLLMADWRRQGVPLHLVLSAIQETLEGDRRQRRVTLRYCKPAVEAAWTIHRENVAQGGAL